MTRSPDSYIRCPPVLLFSRAGILADVEDPASVTTAAQNRRQKMSHQFTTVLPQVHVNSSCKSPGAQPSRVADAHRPPKDKIWNVSYYCGHLLQQDFKFDIAGGSPLCWALMVYPTCFAACSLLLNLTASATLGLEEATAVDAESHTTLAACRMAGPKYCREQQGLEPAHCRQCPPSAGLQRGGPYLLELLRFGQKGHGLNVDLNHF